LAQGALPDMPQLEDFCGFFSVQSAICQQLLKPLHKVPRIANGFNIYGCTTLWTVALKRLIYKQKKDFANISLAQGQGR
jgi:hypothetical protein